MEYPLKDLKVLDFSRVLAGPFAGRLLCDLGADVVKVEPPEGDITRYWGRSIADIPGYYHQQNAGKRNICVDLRTENARHLIYALVEKADILIENYRPDVMARLSLDYATLKEINPGLIMLSISGFGHNGPESKRAAYAPVIHAEVGLIHRSSRKAAADEHSFRDLPLSTADTNASLHGLIGVLSAIILRQQTKRGQHIDISMLDATIATDDQLHYDLEDSWNTGPISNEIWTLPFATVLISSDFRIMFRLLCENNHITDPSLPEMDLAEKIAARRTTVNSFFQTLQTAASFDSIMKQMNMAWGLVRDPAELRQQPTVQARGTIIDIDDRAGGTRPITQSPYRFSDAKSGVRGPAPHRGEHNAQIMQEWLSWNSDEINALHDKGILVHDPQWQHH
ncbi:MAG: CoA transferase [Gammaproteobacteria bacterium]|jgi:CoA:oxalate CoA-transferase|nr:CoA transferase [Gammaproteobacteria bacterium]MBT5202390.1 CoA transferase [Gammaproteobacteria bacterium]MBT5600984.1 CoA transferase [Gammaproteobacteria bacterium]MBT6245283.1 CoA transferase [Gammaproteobacteria bacterium]